jgi:pimeloyl-ACP methyl ester carboxylesterase
MGRKDVGYSGVEAEPVPPARKVFDKRPGLRLLRLFFRACRVLPRAVTAKLALHVFLTPGKRSATAPELALIAQAQRETVVCRGRRVVTYRWGHGPRGILLCHAWGGHGTTLGEFIPPLLARGYSVIAFDAPAHGASPGRVSDMVEYVSTIGLLCEKYGPFDAAIGHSFGAGNLLWAHRNYGLRADKIVLIGCFIHGVWIIEAFGEALGLPPRVVKDMRESLESKYPGELVWDRLSMTDMLKAVSAPLLVVHDHDDRSIPFAQALQLREASRGPAELFATSGLGHRRVLRNRDVVRKVVGFIADWSTRNAATEGVSYV